MFQSSKSYFLRLKKCLIAQSCPTLCDPMDCSPPGSSVHGGSPSKNTEVGCMLSSRGSSQPRHQTQVSYIAGGFYLVFLPSWFCYFFPSSLAFFLTGGSLCVARRVRGMMMWLLCCLPKSKTIFIFIVYYLIVSTR